MTDTKWRMILPEDRNGEPRRVLCDDGVTRTGFFENGWWYFGGRAMRLPDAALGGEPGLTKVLYCEDKP